jgi:hypothetical protein
MLTQTELQKVGNFDAQTIADLGPAIGFGLESLTVTASAVSQSVYVSELTVSGTMAFTLAAPVNAGQRKLVRCVSAASTPLATLTVTNPDTTTGFVCAGTFQFDAVGQSVEFVAINVSGTLRWRAIRIERAGGAANDVVVGTTVLTGFNLKAVYYCSVTGTVSSTTTKGIPNGSAVGETCQVAVSTAASIPSGTISFTGLTQAGAAATTLGTMAATANFATLRWNGSAWYVIGNSTLVAS